jgi:SAM-dependent methyltransferase
MSEHPRFDEEARAYNATVQNAIGASGETVQFFADLKVRLMLRVLGRPGPSVILDFGCGIGNTTRSIAAAFPSAHIVGFDVSQVSLDLARELTASDGRVTFPPANDRVLPLPDASIDVAFASCVFHHIEPHGRRSWARELARVLRPGGRLFLFEHNPYNPLTRRVVRKVPFDEGVELLRPSEAVSLLTSADLEASRPWFYFFFPAFLRFLRPLEIALKHVPIGAQYFVTGRRAKGLSVPFSE